MSLCIPDDFEQCDDVSISPTLEDNATLTVNPITMIKVIVLDGEFFSVLKEIAVTSPTIKNLIEKAEEEKAEEGSTEETEDTTITTTTTIELKVSSRTFSRVLKWMMEHFTLKDVTGEVELSLIEWENKFLHSVLEEKDEKQFAELLQAAFYLKIKTLSDIMINKIGLSLHFDPSTSDGIKKLRLSLVSADSDAIETISKRLNEDSDDTQ